MLSAVSCLSAKNPNAKDLKIANLQFVQKRMIDFYDQTLDFLLIMQSMLEDFKPSNSGKRVFKGLGVEISENSSKLQFRLENPN